MIIMGWLSLLIWENWETEDICDIIDFRFSGKVTRWRWDANCSTI